jgi:hypothetical protein
VGALLSLASMELVLAERAGGNVIAYGIPVWVGQAVLPLGFALITLRLARSAASNWPAQLAVLALAAAVAAAAGSRLPLGDATAILAISVVLIAAILGSPVFATLGGVALFLFWGDSLPMASVALDQYRMVVNPSLPMTSVYPAGYFSPREAPHRLIRVTDALLEGCARAAIATVWSAHSSPRSPTRPGSASRWEECSCCWQTRAIRRARSGCWPGGIHGGMLPPGLPWCYAIVARSHRRDVRGRRTRAAAVVVALWGLSCAPRATSAPRKVDWREAGAALLAAKWELLLPVVAFLGLFAGFATPVEAAALTAVYAFIVEVMIYRDLDFRRDVPRVMAQCGLLVGGVLLILGLALGFTNYLVDARVPERTVDWVTGAIGSRYVFLIALNLFLLAAGSVLDVFSATVVLVPLIVPLGLAFGVDLDSSRHHLLVNMELGYLTPPVGMNLFFTAYRFAKPLPEVFRAALPWSGARHRRADRHLRAVAGDRIAAAPFERLTVNFTVIIIGAGITGIGAAYHLRANGISYAILEGKQDVGGVWNTHRWHGARCDSDLIKYSFSFKPFLSAQCLQGQEQIQEYLRSVAEEFSILENIRFGTRVTKAVFSVERKSWTVHTTQATYTAQFLVNGNGYYSDDPYVPVFRDAEKFRGEIVHTSRLDGKKTFADKRVVLVGSGATAICCAPELARVSKSLVLLQRSPSYIYEIDNKVGPLITLCQSLYRLGVRFP